MARARAPRFPFPNSCKNDATTSRCHNELVQITVNLDSGLNGELLGHVSHLHTGAIVPTVLVAECEVI